MSANDEKLEHDEDLIGQQMWWGDLPVEVVELGDEPTEPVVYLTDARVNLALGAVPLCYLTETPTSSGKSKEVVFSEAIVDKIVFWVDHEVRIGAIKTYPSEGKVCVQSITPPHYKALVNVADLSKRHRVFNPEMAMLTSKHLSGITKTKPATEQSLQDIEAKAFEVANGVRDMVMEIRKLTEQANSE